MEHNKTYDVIIIGAGISGLTAAYKEKKAGKSVLLIEKERKQGGVIQSFKNEFGNFELGPNSFAISDETITLIKELGLENELIYANSSAQKRYIYLNGKPTLINPKTLLFSSKVLSFNGRLKLISERFKKTQDIEGETLGEAIRRRFSDEILQTLVNPVISGIYAGDTEKLEYKSAMKKLYLFEKEQGSFTKGFLQSRKQGSTRKVVSFKNGLQQLIIAIADKLRDNIIIEKVQEIEYHDDFSTIVTETQKYNAKKAILSTPAYVTGELLGKLDISIANKISSIPYPSLLSLQLAFDKNKVKSHLDAFGLLIPKQANKITLGIINYSSVFGNNPDFHQYNLFVNVNQESDIDAIISKATSELKDIYQIEGKAAFENHKIWNKAIPQFNVGYAALMEEIDSFEFAHPSLKLIGNWRTGVAIGDCM